MASTQDNFGKFSRILWLLVILGMLLVAALFVYIAKTKLPDTESLENPDIELATLILADDGQELGKAFKLNREWITFEEINPHLVDALISTEDERYYSHSGIDMKGTVRAFAYLGKRGGASTITQQLAKQFFTKRASSQFRRLRQKLREWVIAVEFEKRYTKEEILAMYLNKFDFLYGANGISAAAQTYFNKNQKQLSVDEAAILIGMLKNPNLYNPRKYPANAIKRRNTVLKQMKRNHKISDTEYAALKDRTIDMSAFKREEAFTGIAPYLRAELQKDVKKILSQDRYLKADGTKYQLYTDGLKIHTTIDMDMQRHAEAQMLKHMKALQEKFFKRWKGKDPWTYNADSRQKKIRSNSLIKQMRDSDRYQKLRQRHLTKITNKIASKIPNTRLWDGDIFRLFEAEKNPKHLKKLRSQGTITASQEGVYRKILKSPYWPTLKKRWRSLRKASKYEFDKKVKMKVFAYTPSGEKTVVMSPMDSIRYHNMHLQLGSLALDPKTGEVKTWVGGINHKYFKFDHIRSNRQVGSTFKPFIYTTAISDLAMSPCHKVRDIQYTIAAGDSDFGLTRSWSPANANKKFSGQWLTLKEGLKQSKNSVSLKLMKEIGNVQRIKSFTSNLGITKEKVPNYPSICLGTPELSVMEMAGAYTAFANNGSYVKPVFIKKIVDKNGKTIYSGKTEKRKVINPSYNYVMVDMLKYAASFATNRANLKTELGGKTGTTDDYKNGWFLGITPELVVATWVGGDMEWIRFLNIQDGQGAVMARPYCINLIKALENDSSLDYDSSKRFAVPDDLRVEIDCSLYESMEKEDAKRIPTIPNNSDEEFEEEF